MEDALTIKRDKIIEIVKQEGPLLPMIIMKGLEIDSTYAGAMMSEMVSSNMLKITNVKKGGSPFYYLDGQEEKLEALIENLNEKDQQTSQLLKKKGVLRDKDLSPLQRVSLRQIKDYAKEVQVKRDNEVDLFWRWYLLEESKVKGLITEYLQTKPIREVKPMEKPVEEPSLRKNVHEEKGLAKEEFHEEREEIPVQEEKQAPLVEPKPLVDNTRDPLGSFFVDNGIEVLQQDIIKKGKELNYLVGLDTRIGKNLFFLKYRNKKKISEADLSLALHEAKNLPLIFVTNGSLTKKAKEMMNKEFRGMMFKQI
ncbi:MAG: hypothetical protein CMH63_00435 [Nanoarchaeota archaeon]|jgi:hypothetical protein|nr:hypothetical protein [Nanoarchaeota archaeon]|tara:strand:- start:21629 stop:22558 length:930 start_codon:yes stop_codon:yes gene_type:complete